jgi:hypothetical protein
MIYDEKSLAGSVDASQAKLSQRGPESHRRWGIRAFVNGGSLSNVSLAIFVFIQPLP